jgi:mono/diheme cytochrome c family protein
MMRRACAGVTIGLGAMLWLMPMVLAQVFLAQVVSAQEPTTPDKAKIEAGDIVYNTYCAVCHGDNLVSSGQFPNLRRLTANDRAKFDTTVRNGRNQMPPWKDVLSDDKIDQVWAYIRANAYEK